MCDTSLLVLFLNQTCVVGIQKNRLNDQNCWLSGPMVMYC